MKRPKTADQQDKPRRLKLRNYNDNMETFKLRKFRNFERILKEILKEYIVGMKASFMNENF